MAFNLENNQKIANKKNNKRQTKKNLEYNDARNYKPEKIKINK